MVRQLLVRGLVVGALAGVLAFVIAYVFGKPQIQRAIDFEDAAGPALVSRGVQRSIGLLTGSVVLGASLGGFFALVFARAYGRIAVAQLILPAVHETPAGFPADLLYRFRLASLGINLTLWTAIGLGFGAAAERVLSPASAPSRVRVPAQAI